MDTATVINLPGENANITELTQEKTKKFNRFKTALLSGTAVVLLGAGAVAFLMRPNLTPQIPQIVIPAPKPIPGSASVDKRLEKQLERLPESPLMPTKPDGADPVSEIVSLQDHPSGSQPKPGVTALVQPTATTSPVPVATALTPAAHPKQEAVKPRDPAQTAASLTPVPMTAPEQLQVLSLVSELGVIVRDLREENSQLHKAIDKAIEGQDAKIAEFDQRLSLAEAHGAIAAAMGAGKKEPSQPVEQHAERKVEPVAVPVSTAIHHYRVQAASPGLAMLAATDPSPDGTGPIQVEIGGQVPGYGKVKSIVQRGTTWVVQTERGNIQ